MDNLGGRDAPGLYNEACNPTWTKSDGKSGGRGGDPEATEMVIKGVVIPAGIALATDGEKRK